MGKDEHFDVTLKFRRQRGTDTWLVEYSSDVEEGVKQRPIYHIYQVGEIIERIRNTGMDRPGAHLL